LAIERRDDLERLQDINGRRLHQMHARGDGAAGSQHERVSIGFRARARLGCDVARRTGFVVDDDDLARRHVKLFGEEPRQQVGAAAGGKADEEMNVLRWIGLRHRGGWTKRRRNREADDRKSSKSFHVVSPRNRFFRLSRCILMRGNDGEQSVAVPPSLTSRRPRWRVRFSPAAIPSAHLLR
jgi:hypothetical protein